MNHHTPGPWRASLSEFALSNSGQRAITTDEQEPTHIAFVSSVIERKRSTPYNAPDAERDANARLIAAAPELYAVVQAVAEHFAGTDAPLGEAARAALAKVGG